MKKATYTTNQTAFEYAIYMIASSYFDDVECKSTISEGSMLVQYKEQKLDKQYLMEDICIRYMNSLVKRLPKDFFKQKMAIHIKRHGETAPSEIFFVGKNNILRFCGVFAGKKSKIDCQLFEKNTEEAEKIDGKVFVSKASDKMTA